MAKEDHGAPARLSLVRTPALTISAPGAKPIAKPINKVLVIKLGGVGELVMAFPAFERIRQAHPLAKITLLTTEPFAALAKSSPFFNTVEFDGSPKGPGGSDPKIAQDTSLKHEEPRNTSEQGETANIKQNTTNEGFFRGRRIK